MTLLIPEATASNFSSLSLLTHPSSLIKLWTKKGLFPNSIRGKLLSEILAQPGFWPRWRTAKKPKRWLSALDALPTSVWILSLFWDEPFAGLLAEHLASCDPSTSGAHQIWESCCNILTSCVGIQEESSDLAFLHKIQNKSSLRISHLSILF